MVFKPGEVPRCDPATARERAGLASDAPVNEIPDAAFECDYRGYCVAEEFGFCVAARGILNVRPKPWLKDIKPEGPEAPTTINVAPPEPPAA